MISVTSPHLDQKDKKLIREYSQFVISKFVKKSLLDKVQIKIEIVTENDLDHYADVDDLKKLEAWCQYLGVFKEKKHFRIVLNANRISNVKDKLRKYKRLLIGLGHELVHVKQYLNGEMFDYVSGGVKYKGSYFDHSYQSVQEAYYDAPWEIEAYGRELGLYKMFLTKMKDVDNK
jgi:hypothetical protein